MAYVLSYTKPGVGLYNYISDYPMLETPYNCDWEHSMHLAISDDGKKFKPLRNNTGILFPKGSYDEGNPMGVTKTLQYPWIFRMADGTFGVAAVRRNQNASDPVTKGCMMLFTSKNLVRYEESCFLRLSDEEIKNPRCRYDGKLNAYYLEWETENGRFCGYTRYFKEVGNVKSCMETSFCDEAKVNAEAIFVGKPNYSIKDVILGNVVEVTDEEATIIRNHFDEIYNIGVETITMEVSAGKQIDFNNLPKATFLYSDGSTHKKKVNWDKESFEKIDFTRKGEYEIQGEVCQKHYPFPMTLGYGEDAACKDGQMSDPCVTYYNGKYYLTSSGGNPIQMRIGDTIDEAFGAVPIDIPIEWEEDDSLGTWAAELHIINDVPYIMTAFCSQKHQFVRAYVLRCNGDPGVPDNWEQPKLCVKPNGNVLTEGGISLDMTYFCVEGVHYIMWSDRKVPSGNLDFSNADPADIYIATIDPDMPWKCTTEPQCILRPTYGFDRFSTNVDEGPYLLKHGDDLFITVSGSSTGVADLYNLSLLRSKVGNNLLSQDGWDFIPYPFLTKESVENQYGPGHNNFVKDPENGDDLMVYHAVPHDENGKALGRKPGVRRVHYAATGLPYLEMTEERDLCPEYKNVTMKIVVS